MKAVTNEHGKFLLFYGSVFSNWHKVSFVHDGQQFQNSEQAFMYEKALLMGDSKSATKILQTPDPASVKALGRKITPWNEQLWVENRFDIMTAVLVSKFGSSKELTEVLIFHAKEYELVEASPHDTIWGIGLAVSDPRAAIPSEWRGANELGRALKAAAILLSGVYSVYDPSLSMI